MTYDNQKLSELIVYIARRSNDDPNFGKTKLLKLLAFTDFLAYGRRRRPVTGATYIKLEFGPAPREAPAVIAALDASGAVSVTVENAYGYAQTRVVANREATPGVLSEDELRIADEVIERYRSWNNSALSEESHREFTGWRMVEEGEEIPYRSVFLAADQTPSPEAIEYGQKVAGELGLLAAS
jgi:hypothetical protein